MKDDKDVNEFIAPIINIGNSIGVIIPNNNVVFSGLKQGQTLKVYYKIIKK